ncbi:MAG: type II toxin-antitoxin system prevent-host-death family antitoxin [Clostridiales Family XIII bacterium]|jgi:prevent-host-death family protein|nr:type II toxin-antitoxin system prevent-host-death family antitoxin [Clostridiales Family XIII bacterium]
MYNIRPVSDLRSKLHEIEETVKRGESVFLTKNGYGSMVVLSIERYAELTNEIERKLDEADAVAAATTQRYTMNEVYSEARKMLDE